MKSRYLVLVLSGLAVTDGSYGQVPELINYQGRLVQGTNLVNGSVSLVLRLYDAVTLGNLLYEDSNDVTVADGLYSTFLGDNTTAGSLMDALTNSPLYLEVSVNGSALSPRERVAAAGYALKAAGVSTGAITSAMIADGAVSNADLAANSVTSGKIADGSVSNADLAANSVTSNKIASSAVGLSQLARDYQSGGVNLVVPPTGLDTVITAVFSSVFASTPAVTMNLSTESPASDWAGRNWSLLLLQKSVTGFIARLCVESTTNGMPVNVDTNGSVGTSTSLGIVNGNPAISYSDVTGYDLWFARALDVAGTAWGVPTNLVSPGIVGNVTSLKVVDGNPAISYYEASPGDDLKYIRANDASGASWGAPVTLDTNFLTGLFPSLDVVAGNPAISYLSFGLGLAYIRANDASGGVWGARVMAAAGTVYDPSLEVVGGNPAISYYDYSFGNLLYVRALDPTGGVWGTPVSIDTAGDVGAKSTLSVVNGNPAISYYDVSNGDLKYVRANDATGGVWGTPIAVDTNANVGDYASMAVIGGKPAISYFDSTESNLKFVRALDANGATWGAPTLVDTNGFTGQHTSLEEVNGRPGISYYDSSNGDLKFVSVASVPMTVEWIAVEP